MQVFYCNNTNLRFIDRDLFPICSPSLLILCKFLLNHVWALFSSVGQRMYSKLEWLRLWSQNYPYNIGLRRGIYGSFFLSFSSSQVVNFIKWKHHCLSENIIFFHSNDDLFTQYLFLNKKRCHLMNFSWRLESKRTRGKRNHKFRALDESQSNYLDSASGDHKVDSI